MSDRPVSLHPGNENHDKVIVTGVKGLDRIMGSGGIPRRSLTVIAGPPGSGKTTLANQIAFHAATNEKMVLIFTAYSETTNKLISHLRTMTFYNEHVVGDKVIFINLEQFLVQGLTETVQEIVRLTRLHRADVVVVDGFRSISDAAATRMNARQFLYEVGTQLGVLGTTTFVTTESEPRNPQFFAEATTADVILSLNMTRADMMLQRSFEVIKARGTRMLDGAHGMEISVHGVTIYPRLEAIVVAADTDDATGGTAERWSMGIPSLDELMGGGIYQGTSTLIVGPEGTGKTFYALHFAATMLQKQRRIVYVTFGETIHQLTRKITPFAIAADLLPYLHQQNDSLRYLRLPPIELQIDRLMQNIMQAIDEIEADVLIIDGMTEIRNAVATAHGSQRDWNFLAALNEFVHQRHMTSLLLSEQVRPFPADRVDVSDALAVLAENVLSLQYVQRSMDIERLITIDKMRFSAFHSQSSLYTIDAPEGVIISRVTDEHRSASVSTSFGQKRGQQS